MNNQKNCFTGSIKQNNRIDPWQLTSSVFWSKLPVINMYNRVIQDGRSVHNSLETLKTFCN